MKRIGDIFPTVISDWNCVRAIVAASKHKRRRKSVKEIFDDRTKKAGELTEILQNYTPSDYRVVIRREGLKKKERHILVPRFWPDQCVQHAIIDPLRKPLMRRFCYWSCGSMPKRGNAHAKRGVERATLYDQKHAKYCLQMDAVHCYENIKPDMMMAILCDYIKDKRVLALLEKIVRSCDGLPIGNYSSPWLCNIYLDRLDHLITDKLQPCHYVRYMDDLVLLDSNKRKLVKAEKAIREYAHNVLKLEMHDNATVFKVRRDGEKPRNDNRAVDFIGYRFCLGYTVLRRTNALVLMRQSNRIQRALALGLPITYHTASGFTSRASQLKHCKSKGLQKAYVDPIPTKILKGVIRGESKRQQRTCDNVSGGAPPAGRGKSHCDHVRQRV